MGQSNAEYHGAGGEWGISDNVFAWDNLNGLNSLLDIGKGFYPAAYGVRPFRPGCNNQFAHAAELLSRRTGRQVRLILIAKGSTSIVSWSENGVRGRMYSRMQAVLAAAGVAKVDAFLWHQGETDNHSGRHIPYASHFAGLLGFLAADGILPWGAPVVIGSVEPSRVNINPVLASIAAASPCIGLAEVGVLPTFDGTHFSGETARPAGALYEAQLAALMGLA